MLGLSFGLGSIGTAITAALADYIGLSTALLLTSLPLLLAASFAAATPTK
jgi:FSR family fosmidomycin resistance protein-like MFS transporter